MSWRVRELGQQCNTTLSVDASKGLDGQSNGAAATASHTAQHTRLRTWRSGCVSGEPADANTNQTAPVCCMPVCIASNFSESCGVFLHRSFTRVTIGTRSSAVSRCIRQRGHRAQPRTCGRMQSWPGWRAHNGTPAVTYTSP